MTAGDEHDDGNDGAAEWSAWELFPPPLPTVRCSPVSICCDVARLTTSCTSAWLANAGERGFVVGSPPTAVDVAPCLELDLRR